MSKSSFANMDNMNSAYSIGHCANFSDNSGSGGGAGLNMHGNMFENKEDIIQAIQSMTTKSNMIHILLPAIDQIFQAIQSSPFCGLEALGIASYIDPSKAVSGLSLPKPISITGNKKDQSRGI